MKLTQEGIELIKRVRDRMYESECKGAESFICWNLVFEASGNPKVDTRSLQDRMEEVGGVCQDIWLAIDRALGGAAVMTDYIYRQSSKRVEERLPMRKCAEYAKMARLAWLDRIIETGEIK